LSNAAVFQALNDTGLIGKKIRQTIIALWKGKSRRFDYEQGLPRLHWQPITSFMIGPNDMHTIGNGYIPQALITGIKAPIAIMINKHTTIADLRFGLQTA
jgi:hypothetical protein